MSEQSQATSIPCPRCERPLRRVIVPAAQESSVIEVCFGGCGGLWLGPEDMAAGLGLMSSDCLLDLQNEAAAVTANRWAMLEVAAGEQQAAKVLDFDRWLNCIFCGKGMVRYRWNGTSPIYLDECPEGHGIWVDGGEIQGMRQYQQAEAMAEQQAAQLKGRLQEISADARQSPAGRQGGGWLDILLDILGTPARRF